MTRTYRAKKDHNTQQGFALVEVLISLTLLALIAASSTLVLLQLRRVQVASQVREQTEEIARYRNILRTVISTALRDEGAAQFAGQNDEIMFHGSVELGPLEQGRYRFVLTGRGGAAQNRELYKIEVLSTELGEDRPLLVRDLPPALAITELSYFGVRTINEVAAWGRNWEERFAPLLVRLEFVGTKEHPQMPLIVGP